MIKSPQKEGTTSLSEFAANSRKAVAHFATSLFSEIAAKSKAFTEGEEASAEFSTTLARKLMQQQETLQKALVNAVNRGFEQLMQHPDLPKKKRPRLGLKNAGINLSELTLVDHDELAQQLMVDKTSTFLQSTYHDLLGEINMRVEAIIHQEIPLARNPLHPQVLCNTMHEAVLSFDLHPADTNLTLRHLFKLAQRHYSTLLTTINSLLMVKGLLPSLDQDAVKYRFEEETRLQAAKEKRLSTLQSFSSPDLADHPVTETDIQEGLSALIKEAPVDEALARHLVKPGKQAVLLSDAEFLDRLQTLSQIPDITRVEADYPKVDDESPTLTEKVRSVIGSANYYFTDRTTNTLSMLSMLFDQMDEDNPLEPQIRYLIHLLQVPLVRAAVLDPLFFSDTENPAQRLLDSLATAGSTWTPSASRQRDSLYNKMATIVSRINREFSDDYSLFDECQQDLDLFVRAERRRARLIEERMVAAEKAKARTDMARLVSARHTARLLKSDAAQSGRLPKPLIAFFSTTWNQVLFYLHNLHESCETEPWKNAVDLEQRLISQLDTQDEKSLDNLLKDVESLLNEVGAQEKEIEKWLDTLSQTYSIDSTELEITGLEITELEIANIEIADLEIACEPSAPTTPDAEEPLAVAAEAAMDTEVKTATGTVANVEAEVEVEVEVEVEAKVEAEPEIEAGTETTMEALANAIDNFIEPPETAPSLVTAGVPVPGETSDELPAFDSISDQFEEIAASLTPNAWVQSNLQGEISKVRVAAVIKHTDKVVLVNRNGSRAATLSRRELAQKLRSGEMTIIENGLFFDRALESVIQNLRK
jgi:hypothetical protein